MPSTTTASFERAPATARTSAASGGYRTGSQLTDASGALQGQNGSDGRVNVVLEMPNMAYELREQGARRDSNNRISRCWRPRLGYSTGLKGQEAAEPWYDP